MKNIIKVFRIFKGKPGIFWSVGAPDKKRQAGEQLTIVAPRVTINIKRDGDHWMVMVAGECRAEVFDVRE